VAQKKYILGFWNCDFFSIRYVSLNWFYYKKDEKIKFKIRRSKRCGNEFNKLGEGKIDMVSLTCYILGRIILVLAPKARLPYINKFALKLCGAEIGCRTKIYSSIKVARMVKLIVGNDTFVGEHAVVTGGVGSLVKIGNDCDISDHVRFVTGTHVIDAEGKRVAGHGYSLDIFVGNGVWIGYGALILPGVTIADKSLIAAGTVVHKNVPPKTIVGGNPMVVIRNI